MEAARRIYFLLCQKHDKAEKVQLIVAAFLRRELVAIQENIVVSFGSPKGFLSSESIQRTRPDMGWQPGEKP